MIIVEYEYEQRTRIDYGNGTFTEYAYDPARRWLDTIKTENKWGQAYQNIRYSFDAVSNVLGYENDCLDNASGNYKTKQTYSYDNLYQLIKVNGETTYNPYHSSAPEFKSNYSQLFDFDSDGLGNMTSKVSTEAVTPQKTIGDNLNYGFNYVYDDNFAHRLISAGDRHYQYDANGNIICEQDGTFESGGDDDSYHKITQETEDVYSTDYGWGLFKEDDASGLHKKARYRRTYTWNERNQLVSSVDSNYNTGYVYGQDGQRSNKYTQSSETLYFNKMWTHHTDSGNSVYGGQTSKNIYLGETRIVTKLNSGSDPTYHEELYKQYFYHSDHLGSASLISDYKGDEYQRIEYTPYGETWVEKTQNNGLEYLPYKFTAKELDEETGLYYYGARYLDPKYSMWISTDPALGEYIPKAPINEEAKKYNQNLPGMGGVFNHINCDLYAYAGNNPVKYTDPDGNEIKSFEYECKQTSFYNRALTMGAMPNGVFDSSGTLTRANLIGDVGCKLLVLLNIGNNINYIMNGNKFDRYCQPCSVESVCNNDKYFVTPYPCSKVSNGGYETDILIGKSESIALLTDITGNGNLSITTYKGSQFVKSIIQTFSKCKETVFAYAKVNTKYGCHFVGLGWNANKNSLSIYDPTVWGDDSISDSIQKQINDYDFELSIVRKVKCGMVE